ncbi:hypothetical protein EG68_10520 [Paragonimus skrjabini miyazakii]|uniref:Transmembrane protein 231 n=1 Tax=Paragonimus skrjabini miyazakii TaxID=59628 RepID=A0A8S9YF97_9TREM|nr:hypothetical protein EG68_10520 [Paragonimus skrjabini miyazakii]
MVEIFHHPEEKYYHATIASRTFIFVSIITLFLFIVPVAIIFTISDGWPTVTTKWARFTDCNFLSQQTILIFYTCSKIRGNYGTMLWTSSPSLSYIWKNSNLVSGASTTSRHEELVLKPPKYAGSTLPKRMKVEFRLNMDSALEVLGVQLFVPISCKISPQYQNSRNVVGLISERYIGQAALSGMDISGTLATYQTSVLSAEYNRMEDYFNRLLPFNFSTIQSTSEFNLEQILYSYEKRNFVLQLKQTSRIPTHSSSSLASLFHISLEIELPKQRLAYETPFTHAVKWTYIRYVSLWIILMWPIKKLLRYTFERNILQDTHVKYGK